MTKSRTVPMGFYHPDGMVPAWNQASTYAGDGGHIATLPEVIAARLASTNDAWVWNTYFTTRSAEYLGRSAAGNLILIVAHGVGPMSTLEGVKKAYSYSFKSKDRDHRGGRISHQEFLDLEAGKYGPVFVVDYDSYAARFQYPFIEATRRLDAMQGDPLLIARLGGESTAAAFIDRATRMHQDFLTVRLDPKLEGAPRALLALHRLKNRLMKFDAMLNPYIVQNSDESNLPYFAYNCLHPDGDLAFAHLLSVGANWPVHYHGEKYPSLSTEISVHSWHDGTRLLAVPLKADMKMVLEGPDAHELVSEHWRELMIPTQNPVPVRMMTLQKMSGEWFTEYREPESVMDSGESQYLVTSIEPVGEQQVFTTPILGYYGFFKYEVDSVEKMAPLGANAYYFTGDPKIDYEDDDMVSQSCPIQFYRVQVDQTRQLMRANQLVRDFDLMIRLMGV